MLSTSTNVRLTNTKCPTKMDGWNCESILLRTTLLNTGSGKGESKHKIWRSEDKSIVKIPIGKEKLKHIKTLHSITFACAHRINARVLLYWYSSVFWFSVLILPGWFQRWRCQHLLHVAWCDDQRCCELDEVFKCRCPWKVDFPHR